jgi:probable selenium-dependent hydroxylase accessory protein YqeC
LFLEHFAFRPGALVNFVGGGGKSTLICALLEESISSTSAIYTTTTRMHPPHPHDGLVIISSEDSSSLRFFAEAAVKSAVSRKWKLVLTGKEVRLNLLGGVGPEFASALDRTLFSAIYNEADGARSVSVKYPREGEPVLMQGAEYLVPVIGMDAIGKPMGPEIIFRWEIAVEKFGLTLGKPLTPEIAAALLMDASGVCRDWKPGMEVTPYLNKVEDEESEANAVGLAKILLSNSCFPVNRVVFGSAIRVQAFSVTR